MLVDNNNKDNNDNSNNNTTTTTTTTFYNPLDHILPTYKEYHKCTFCQEIKPLLVEQTIYYNQGRNKRIAYLCCTDLLRKNREPCYDAYLTDLGFANHIIIADSYDSKEGGQGGGWLSQTYRIIRSFFISCPCPYYSPILWDKGSNNNNSNDKRKKMISAGGVGNMAFEDAVKLAYRISPIVRNYLNAIDKKKVPDPTDIKNPRL